MVTDLAEIRRRSKEMRAENLEFRRRLKARHYPEGPFRILAREVEKQVDCTACANCCRQYHVSLSGGEVEALAEFLEVPVPQFREQYTRQDPDDSRVAIIRHANGECVFLDGNMCMVYDARPSPCREYPYLSSKVRSVGNRMPSLFRRAFCCPIAFNVVERYKHLLGFGR